ncbi:MAG: hypothetical protein KJ592_00490, partial [Nanoarchaeota archaeon]|nr:hypothetical protein [Nanoarchaeota archaeon]
VVHYPNLKTVLAVEKVLMGAEVAISREEIKRRLSMKIMHQTLNLILKYLEERGMILDGRKGVLWIWNDSPKMRAVINSGVEV